MQIKILSGALTSLTIFLLIGLASCTEDDPIPVTVDAEAGDHQTIELGDDVVLDGSTSSASDGSEVDFMWTITESPAGSSVSLTDATTPTPSFTPDEAGVYVVTLNISHEQDQDTDDVVIIVEDPTATLSAEAGGLVTVETGTQLTLDGTSSSSSDGSSFDYLWEIMDAPANSTATVTNPTSASATFTPDVAGNYLLVLTISNADGQDVDDLVVIATDPGATLEADAGSDQTVNLGESVTLDGSNSSSSDGSSFNYLWEITNAPDGSTATLSDPDTSTPDFTPDVAGDYTITLTISNGSNQSTDEVIIIVQEVTTPLEIGGVIDSETTLNNRVADPTLPDYTASSTVDVRALLTIEPGVMIYFSEDVVMDIEQAGTLVAVGTASEPIIFNSSNTAGGLLWKGIYIASASTLNELDHVTISNAGNSTHNFSGTDYAAAIGVESTGKVSLTNSTITDNNGYGLYVDDGGGELENFSNNIFNNNNRAIGIPADEVDAIDGATTFSNNADAQVEIFSTTYSSTKTTIWPDLNGNASYHVSGNLTVDGNLTIAPGAIFELDENVMMTVNGSLIAEGTDTDHITFTTSNTAGSLYWKGIYIPSASNLNSFEYVDLSYAGNTTMNFSGTDYAAGIGVESTGNVSVNNSTISNNKEYGLYIDDNGGRINTFSNNHFENNPVAVGVPANEANDIDGNTTFTNNTSAEVEIFSSTLSETQNVTWNALNGDASYRVTGNIIIDGVLTLDPGLFMELDQNVLITVNGAFIADGTDTEMITLTTSNIPGGLLWKGLYFASADARNLLDYVTVSYGGNEPMNFSGTDFSANVGIDTGGRLTVTNSVITDSGSYGIYNKGTLTESDNTYSDNPNGNVL